MYRFIVQILGCLAALTFLLPRVGVLAAEVSSKRDCAICHIMWLDEFRINKETLIKWQPGNVLMKDTQGVVSSEEVCYSCHDGYVNDSRFKVWEKSGHKISVKPSENVEVPSNLPLSNKDEIYCGTCHSAHGTVSEKDGRTSFFRVQNQDSSLCKMCHRGEADDSGKSGHPMKGQKTRIPEGLIRMGAVPAGDNKSLICQTCHMPHGSVDERILVGPAEDGGLCLQCHTDKQMAAGGLKKANHVINVTPKSAVVPKSFFDKGAKLGDRGVITCLTCHKVHRNQGRSHLLVVENDSRSTLCLTCHSDKKHLAKTRHNLIRTAPREKNLQNQTAGEGGICSACHLPHKQARSLSGKGDFTSQMCFSCHSTGNVGEKIQVTGNSHPLNVSPLEKGAQGGKVGLPLFNKVGVRDSNGKMTCATCHDPHRSEGGSKQPLSGPDKAGTSRFLRQPEEDICQACHQGKFAIAKSKHDLSLSHPEATNILGEKASETGICGSCHMVHNSQEAFLWARKRETKRTASAGGLCVECHSDQGLASKKVVKDYSHPVNVSPVEQGLDPTLPLYDKEGKVSRDGVMTCQTCHEPHRWDPVRSTAGVSDEDGNAGNSFLRMAAAPSSKLCVDCHSEEGHVEKTDHDLLITAPMHENLKGERPQDSGTCGVCHSVHNSQNWAYLWAQPFGTGGSLLDMMCNSCHNKNGAAKNKVPEIATHPEGKQVSNIGRDRKGAMDYFPLFHEHYGEPTSHGNVSCASCHNAHRWDSGLHKPGAGKNVEGDAATSFLRNRSSLLPCKECHGREALLRYKFYHKANARGGFKPIKK